MNNREALYRAAISCRHEITHDQIILYVDSRKEGNALSQLADRLEQAAIASQAQQPVPVNKQLNFIGALKIADEVFAQYKIDQFKWWQRLDGTPILNDVSVRMAKAFVDGLSSPAPEGGDK